VKTAPVPPAARAEAYEPPEVADGENRPPRAQRWPQWWPPALRTAEAFTLRQTASEPRIAVKAIRELADGVSENQTAEP